MTSLIAGLHRLLGTSRRVSPTGLSGPPSRLVLVLVIVALAAPGTTVAGPRSEPRLHPALAGHIGGVGTTAATPTGGDPQAAPTAPALDEKKVRTHNPDVVVEQIPPGADLRTAEKTSGVSHASPAARFPARVVTGSAGKPGPKLRVMAVDPARFRPLAPETAAADHRVWLRLAQGEVVLRKDVARRLKIELGGQVQLRRPDGRSRTVRVGAFASNGAPPLADALVPWTIARDLGIDAPDTLLAAVDEQASASSVGRALSEALGAGKLSLREVPSSRQARLPGTARSRLEPFSYHDRGDGTIAIDPAWVDRWITTVMLPHLGRARCHRAMVPQLLAALQEIEAVGLAHHLEPEQFMGCWVPRRIDWDPSRSLSMHAWGLAVDINAEDNPLGARPTIHPRIVEIFRKWGFEWGGSWDRPDGMHFELAQIIEQR